MNILGSGSSKTIGVDRSTSKRDYQRPNIEEHLGAKVSLPRRKEMSFVRIRSSERHEAGGGGLEGIKSKRGQGSLPALVCVC